MPLALKLSKEFYDRLGQNVTNELVSALNAVDASYRQEFRELFDAHFRVVDERMRALESMLTGRMEALESLLTGRMEALESLLTGRMEALESRLNARMDALEYRLEGRMDAKLAELKSELLRWMFLFWVGTMGTVLAIVKL